MKQFYVIKESHTFSDSLECLGLAKILKRVAEKISRNQDNDILIEDKGSYFKLTSDVDIPEDEIGDIEFFYFMEYVTKKDKTENLPFPYIDYDHEKKVYDDLRKSKKSAERPRPDYDIIRLYAGMDGYRKVFYNLRKFNNGNFTELLRYMLKYYSSKISERNDAEEKILSFVKEVKGVKQSELTQNALQDINPDKGKGINRIKPDSVRPDSYKKMIWYRELIKFVGGWQGMTSKYVGKDYKTYVIAPHKIGLQYMNGVFASFKKKIYGGTSIQVDILMLLNLTEELILKHENYRESWNIFKPSHVISGLQFAYYKNLGQKPAVTNIGFLGIPSFIVIKDKVDADKWKNIIEEHQKIIHYYIGKKNSSHVKILQDYRNFISIGDFDYFFEFSYGYANIIFSTKKPFSITNMEGLMRSDVRFEDIFLNDGFKAIAGAIRNSTIVPIIHKDKKNVVFGLSNKLRIASRNKDSLVEEISEFIQKYNERMMLEDYHDEPHNKYITKENLEEFYKLLDSDHSSKIIAGMLVAFGYAKDGKANKAEGNNE